MLTVTESELSSEYFWKTCFNHHEFDHVPLLKTFLVRLVVTLKDDLQMLNGEECQRLEDLRNSVNLHFPSEP